MDYKRMTIEELRQKEAQLMLDYELCDNPVEMGREIKKLIKEIDRRERD